MILMEESRKYFFSTEDEAINFLEKMKEETTGMIIDYKISNKETKSENYTIMTLKIRYKTLAEAKSE